MAKRRRTTNRIINKIQELRKQGHSGPDIAKLVHRSLPTVYRVLKNGVETEVVPVVQNDLQKAVEACVATLVKARLNAVREAVLKALGD